MALTTSANFERLTAILQSWGAKASLRSSDTAEYSKFISAFPIERLPHLTKEEYCLGRAINDNFSWWMEIGLRPALGRWFPGSSRAHIMYFKGDALYRHRKLADLSDDEALHYTLTIQATIAGVDPLTDISWVDDDQAIYTRAGVAPRVTVSNGRKLRLIAAYHPESIVPIYSTEHLGHYLEALGCPLSDTRSNRRAA